MTTISKLFQVRRILTEFGSNSISNKKNSFILAIDPFAAENAANKSKSEIKPRKKFVHPKATPEARKELKEKSRLRKARIILRNVSYKVNESNLKERFAKYGEIREVNILKRPDGKLVGCAFIQFDKVNHAAKAIHHENAKEFLGRPVVIDWAVNQKKFISHLKKQRHEIKKESDNVEIKSEEESDGENAGENDSVEEKSASDNNNNEATSEEEEDENDDNDDVDGEEDGEDSDADKKDEKKPIHKLSNDVAEGCTVFIKNVPFEATNEDLRKVCSQFGPLYYAVITKDKVSGHSKGNGFVKFKVCCFTFLDPKINFNLKNDFIFCRLKNLPICVPMPEQRSHSLIKFLIRIRH